MGINTARDFLLALYGSELVTSIDETDATVGTSATLIANRNGATMERIVSNNGAAATVVSSKQQVTATTGIQIGPNSTLAFTAKDDFGLQECDLWAISTGAGNAVHVIAVNLIGDDS